MRILYRVACELDRDPIGLRDEMTRNALRDTRKRYKPHRRFGPHQTFCHRRRPERGYQKGEISFFPYWLWLFRCLFNGTRTYSLEDSLT
jgi:hypothetical protein